MNAQSVFGHSYAQPPKQNLGASRSGYFHFSAEGDMKRRNPLAPFRRIYPTGSIWISRTTVSRSETRYRPSPSSDGWDRPTLLQFVHRVGSPSRLQVRWNVNLPISVYSAHF